MITVLFGIKKRKKPFYNVWTFNIIHGFLKNESVRIESFELGIKNGNA